MRQTYNFIRLDLLMSHAYNITSIVSSHVLAEILDIVEYIIVQIYIYVINPNSLDDTLLSRSDSSWNATVRVYIRAI